MRKISNQKFSLLPCLWWWDIWSCSWRCLHVMLVCPSLLSLDSFLSSFQYIVHITGTFLDYEPTLRLCMLRHISATFHLHIYLSVLCHKSIYCPLNKVHIIYGFWWCQCFLQIYKRFVVLWVAMQKIMFCWVCNIEC